MLTKQLTDWSPSSDGKVNEDEPATRPSLTPVNTSHREAVISVLTVAQGFKIRQPTDIWTETKGIVAKAARQEDWGSRANTRTGAPQNELCEGGGWGHAPRKFYML